MAKIRPEHASVKWHLTDANRKEVFKQSAVCFYNVPDMIKATPSAHFIHYKPHYAYTTDGDALYYEWMKSVWHMPGIIGPMDLKEWNKEGLIIDLTQVPFWHMWIALYLARYPMEFGPNFTQLFIDRHQKYPKVPLTHIFMWNHGFPGEEGAHWNGNHQLFHQQPFLLDNVTDETLEEGWNKFADPRPARQYSERPCHDTKLRERMKYNGFDTTNMLMVGGPNGVARLDIPAGWEPTKKHFEQMYPKTHEELFGG